MKFARLLFIAFMGITIVNTIPARAIPRQHNKKYTHSFIYYCQQKNNLPKQTQHTVKVLLQKVDTQNCAIAEQKLTKLRILDLTSNHISDLSPLARLTNLTELYLSYNKIGDLSPLAKLTNLNFLFLESNQITDISVLSRLSNLTWLFLAGNPIENKICPVKPESVCKFDADEELLVPEEEVIALILTNGLSRRF